MAESGQQDAPMGDEPRIGGADFDGPGQPLRVYVDGVFDLFHTGHLEFLKKARDAGRDACGGARPVELWAGVITDEEARWKRAPVVPHIQRVALVRACRYVDRIIADPPLHLTDEFLDTYAFDIVVHGDDDRQEKFFGAAIRRGIMRYVPYCRGGPYATSTTSLIDSITRDAVEAALDADAAGTWRARARCVPDYDPRGPD